MGKFFITVAAANEQMNEHYDWRDKEYVFNVINNTRNDGLVNMQCEWMI